MARMVIGELTNGVFSPMEVVVLVSFSSAGCSGGKGVTVMLPIIPKDSWGSQTNSYVPFMPRSKVNE